MKTNKYPDTIRYITDLLGLLAFTLIIFWAPSIIQIINS